jgi:hypothetical protein
MYMNPCYCFAHVCRFVLLRRFNEVEYRWVTHKDTWTYKTALTIQQLISTLGGRFSSIEAPGNQGGFKDGPPKASTGVNQQGPRRGTQEAGYSQEDTLKQPAAAQDETEQQTTATGQTASMPVREESAQQDIPGLSQGSQEKPDSESAADISVDDLCPDGVALDVVLDGVDTLADVLLGAHLLARLANFHRCAGMQGQAGRGRHTPHPAPLSEYP